MPSPANSPQRRESDHLLPDVLARLAKIDEHLSNQDKRLDQAEGKLNCILEGINGTVENKGLAGRVRDLEEWRERIDATINRLIWYVLVPLSLTLLLAVAGFLWGLWTNAIEIVIHR